MMYSQAQEGSRNVFRIGTKNIMCALLVLAVLFVGIISIARPAQAQFGPNFPFGYGGGPQIPTPPTSPNAALVVGRVIARINAMLDRLFNR
jgi:hypothetical protein